MLHKLVSLLIAFLFAQEAFAQPVFQANLTQGCSPLGITINVTSPASSAISSYSWSITLPNGTVQTSSIGQYAAIFSQPGTYDVSLTINGTQTQTILDYITVHASPSAQISVSDSSGCFPFCTQFSDNSIPGSGTITSWNWDFGNGSTSHDQNPSFCYPSQGIFTPVLSVQDVNGCFSSISKSGLISVSNHFPNAEFTLSSSLTCTPPEVISFTNNSTGTSSLSCNWNFGDGVLLTDQAMGNSSHNYENSGSYNVCLKVVDAIGCQNEECRPLTIFDSAQALFSVSTTTICASQNISFTNLTIPPATSYQWDFNGDGITDSTNPNPVHPYPSNGTYPVSLIATYSPTCSDTVSNAYTINVSSGISPVFSVDHTQSCEVPFTVHFTNQTPGVFSQIRWFVNGAQVSSESDFSYTFTQAGLYDIVLKLTSSSGCFGTLTRNDYIKVSPPVISFEIPEAICTHVPLDVSDLLVNSYDPIVNYSWDFNGDGIEDASGTSPVFEYETPGSYPVTLKVTTATGCEETYTYPENILVLENVETSISSNVTTSCAGEAVEFCVTNQPGTTFSWNFGDSSGWETMPDDDICITHDYQDTGYFDITITVFNDACNSTKVFENFIYISPPVAIWQYNVDCIDLLTVEFGDQSILADTLVWNFGDGSSEIMNETSLSHTFPGPGTYHVSLTAINDDVGCPDVSENTIVLIPVNTALNFSSLNACPPILVSMNSPAENVMWDVVFSNGDHVHIQWSEQSSLWNVSYSHGGATENNSYGPNENFWPTLSFPQQGCYDATITTINRNGCQATETLHDAVCAGAGVDFAAFTSTIVNACDPVQILFNASASTLVQYQWQFSDGGVSSAASPTHTFSPPFYYNFPVKATLTATDAQGCSSSVTQEIDITLPVIPSFTIPDPFACKNEEVHFVNTTVGPATSYEWTFGDTLSGEANTSHLENGSHSYTQNGDYTICLSADNGAGCIRTKCNDQSIHVVSPTASLIYNPVINNCLYGVDFTNTSSGTITNVEWDFGDLQTSVENNTFHTYPLGVYDVVLKVSNTHGCSDSTIVPDIFNYGNMIGPFSYQLDSANCIPFTVHFQAFNPNDDYFNYFWDFDDGSGDPTGSTTPVHDYLDTGTFCPSIIMTDPNGCNVLIECTQPFEISIFELSYSSPEAICKGDSILFNVENGQSYSWNDTTHIESGAAVGEYFLFPENSTDYVLTGYYSDCVSIDTIAVTVYDLPEVSLEMDPTICFNDAVFPLFGGLPSGAGGVYSINGSAVISFDPSWPANTMYDIVYSYTDNNSCVSSDTTSLFIHPLPAIEFTSLPSACANDSLIELNTAFPEGGVYQFAENEISFFDPAIGGGSYPVDYTYMDSLGCSNTATQNVVIHPVPVALLSIANLCLYESLNITNSSTITSGNIDSVSWDFGVLGMQNTFSPTSLNFPTPGNYPIHLTLSSSEGCLAQLDTSVSVSTVPKAYFNEPLACQLDSTQFVSLSTVDAGEVSDWLWLNESQSFSGNDTVEFVFPTWGDTELTLVAISESGCRDSITRTITVRPAPVVNIEFNDNCFGELSVMHANATIPLGGIVSYQWNLGEGIVEPANPDADNLYQEPGDKPISVVVTSNLSCSTTARDTLTVLPLPAVNFAIYQPAACEGSPIFFFDLTSVENPQTISSWQWYLEGDLISTETNPVSYYIPAGLYDLKLVIESDQGCISDTNALDAIQINPNPVAGFIIANDHLSMSAPMVEVLDDSSEDVVSWSYDFGDEYTEDFEDGTHTYESWNDFQIVQIVTNFFGCSDTTERVVHIDEEMLIYIPNAFTPEGNGHNEVFKPVMSGFEITYYEFEIFNRWGTPVFKSNDPEASWNGTLNNTGEMSQDGSYSWILKIRETNNPVIQTKQGVVILLR